MSPSKPNVVASVSGPVLSFEEFVEEGSEGSEEEDWPEVLVVVAMVRLGLLAPAAMLEADAEAGGGVASLDLLFACMTLRMASAMA